MTKSLCKIKRRKIQNSLAYGAKSVYLHVIRYRDGSHVSREVSGSVEALLTLSAALAETMFRPNSVKYKTAGKKDKYLFSFNFAL